MGRQIVCNMIRTPDGTILESHSRHDYKTHLDKNGHTYMVDGGTYYLRRNIVKEAPHEELSIYADDPHSMLRNVVKWGTYGKEGNKKLQWIKLKDMETDHIEAVLKNCPHIAIWRKEVYCKELENRFKDGKDECG